MGIDLKLPGTGEALRPEENTTITTAHSALSPGAQAAIQNRFGTLSVEEQTQVDDFAEKIDLHSANLTTDYALGAQSNMRNLTKGALKGVSGKDIGNIEDLLVNMSLTINSFNEDFGGDLDGKRGIFGFFKKAKRDIAVSKERMRIRYEDVSTTLNGIVKKLERHIEELRADSEMVEGLYKENENYFKELTMYILAGHKALRDATDGELSELRRIAEESGTPEDAQAYQDFQRQCLGFEKRLYDLELTREICLQAAPQLRLIRASNEDTMQQITSAINNSIPLWEHGITTALALNRSARAGDAARAVREMTSAMLVSNAERLHTNSVNAAKLSEEGFIDPEAIKKCNQLLIQTITDTTKVHVEGLQKRNEARMELGKLEADLKVALLQPYTGGGNRPWIA